MNWEESYQKFFLDCFQALYISSSSSLVIFFKYLFPFMYSSSICFRFYADIGLCSFITFTDFYYFYKICWVWSSSFCRCNSLHFLFRTSFSLLRVFTSSVFYLASLYTTFVTTFSSFLSLSFSCFRRAINLSSFSDF